MTPEQFTYWLQGFVELNRGRMPTKAQWKSVREHLSTVLVKVTPEVEDERPDRVADILERVREEETPADRRARERENRRRLSELVGPIRSCSHDVRIC